MAEVNVKEGTISDVIELIEILETLRLQLHRGDITEGQAKVELSILKAILQTADMNLRYLRMRKWLAGAMPIMAQPTAALAKKIVPGLEKEGEEKHEENKNDEKPN